MKKSLVVSIGIILILLVLCVWLYLLFFGTPKNSSDVFTNLGLETTARPAATDPVDTTPLELPEDDPTLMLDMSKPLNQLTLRPVAGFGYVGTSSSHLRYIERGTGHMFEIDIDTGNERRISGTTVPRVVEGFFSPSGNSVAVVVETEDSQSVYVGRINAEAESVDLLSLPNGASQPTLLQDNAARYIRSTSVGTEGYEIDIDTGESVRLFSVPLKEITMIWNDDRTYLYNKPTRYATGALYQVEGGLTPVLPAEFGFVGGVADQYYLSSYNENGYMTSYARRKDSKTPTRLTSSYVPEKCTTANDTRMWCASPYNYQSSSFLEEWYRGETQPTDILWVVDMEYGNAQSVTNFLAESGRAVDIDRIIIDKNKQILAFRNKIDNTLWMYDTRQ